jgi:hypothetical protein
MNHCIDHNNNTQTAKLLTKPEQTQLKALTVLTTLWNK